VASVVDLLAPPCCALCGAGGPLLCEACVNGLPRLGRHGCRRCGEPGLRDVPRCGRCMGRRLGFTSSRSAIRYEGSGRLLVHRLKAGGLRDLASPAAELIEAAVVAPAVDVLTWVPPDRWRTIQRGYHPAELIARELAARWRIEARPLLRGPLFRRPQRGLRPAQRRANVRRAFRPAGPVPRHVCLIDDVQTTGATLSACGTELRRGGAKTVLALTLARATPG
jgi:predicted amidophosphoribosyltransferase